MRALFPPEELELPAHSAAAQKQLGTKLRSAFYRLAACIPSLLMALMLPNGPCWSAAKLVLAVLVWIATYLLARNVARWITLFRDARAAKALGLTLAPLLQERPELILGHSIQALGAENKAYYTEKVKKYGPIFRFESVVGAPGKHSVYVADPVAVRQLLHADGDLVEGYWWKEFYMLLGARSVFSLHGREHTQNRRVLNTVFNEYNVYHSFLPTMRDMVERYVDQWLAAGAAGHAVKIHEEGTDPSHRTPCPFPLEVSR